MYTFKILATISVKDHSDGFVPGTVIYDGIIDGVFDTSAEAIHHGTAVLNGLAGGAAFNAARDTSEVVALELKKT